MAQGGNKGSGRRAVIDMRADKNEIIKDIVLGRRTLTDIAKRIGVDLTTVQRYRDDKITEEMRRSILAGTRIDSIKADTEVINQDRMDVAMTYESLAKRVERLISKAEASNDDSFALAAMEGLRKVLRDVAQLQGKLATNLTVNVSLAESKEWVTLRRILNDVCDEVPAAREPLLSRMRHEVLSVTKEDTIPMTHREFEGWGANVERLAIATRTGNPGWAQLPQSKRVMMDEGGKLFFTGKACKRGHVSPRNEHGDCTQCHLMRLAERRDAV